MHLRRVALAAIVFAVLGIAVVTGRHAPGEATRMAEAAQALLDALPPALAADASFKFDDEERTNWHFIPRPRKGAVLKAMTLEQRELVKTLLRAGTGKAGYDKALNVMALEGILGELEGTAESRKRRDPLLYYVSIFGKPGDKSTWGWRVEGHHLSINYTLANGKVVSSTPTFYGANPANVPGGPAKGQRTLAAVEDLARALLLALPAEQREQAIIAAQAPPDILSGAQNNKVKPLPDNGIRAHLLSEAHRQQLTELLQAYLEMQPPEVAQQLFTEATANWEKVTFAWAGETALGKPHYYRVQGPTFLVEYNNTQNNANHVHSVWRDLRGDFSR